MEANDKNKLAYNSSTPSANIFEDPKITMLPVVFTKKLDEMDSINTNWEPLSFKKITTMLLEESKPEYNRNNISTSTIINKESYYKLENKLNTYFQGSKTQNNNLKLDLESIIQKALINITTSTVGQNTKIKIENETESWSSDDDKTLVSAKRRTFDVPINVDKQNETSTLTKAELDTTACQNVQKMDTQSFIKIENESESWSSDDDKTLVSAKRRTFEIPVTVDNQNERSIITRAELDTTGSESVQKVDTQYLIKIENGTQSWSSDDDKILISPKRGKFEIPLVEDKQNETSTKSKAELGKMLHRQLNKNPKQKKATTTVAEVQSQLKKSKSNAPKIQAKMQDEYEYVYENGVLVDIKRKRRRTSKDKKIESRKKCKVTTKDKKINDAISNKRKAQSQIKILPKLPAQQNENKNPVFLPNTNQSVKKKIRPQDVGLMSIYFCNTGLMAKQQKVTKERYDIGIDGNLEKFFVQSQPPKDFRRHLIEKTVCCLYRRALVITEILDEYDISPTAVNFLRAAHLCEVGACLCCCKPSRSVPQSNTIQLTSQTKRNVASTPALLNEPRASSSDTSIQGKNILYATDKVTKNLLANNYKLSVALRGLVSTLFSNFQGITLTTGSTGKLSAVFNTTFTSWSNTDIQLISTILTKMRKELCASKIPPVDFCNCVNKALNADDAYVEASKLLGSKQLLMLKSLSYFASPKKVLKQDDGTIEYFRGDPKLLQNAVSEPLNFINKVVTGGTQQTTVIGKEIIVKPSKEIKRYPKTRTKGKQRDKSEALRECVFVPETITEEASETVNDEIGETPTIKNPILQQILSDSAFKSKFPENFGVTQVPLQYLVSVPVTEDNTKLEPRNNVPQINSIAIDVVDLISDEETILP